MLKIRNADQTEFMRVYDFVSGCKPLENYAAHFYKIMLRYFKNTCFLAEENNEIVGFVLGFISQTHPSTYFLWQIGVDPGRQGKGIGTRFLGAVEGRLREMGVGRVEVTVDPENKPSYNLFENNGYENISRGEGESIEVSGKTAVRDYYSPNRHFILYGKKL